MKKQIIAICLVLMLLIAFPEENFYFITALSLRELIVKRYDE